MPLFAATTTTVFVAKLFGLALGLYAASFFVLAGHYNLYCEWGIRYTWDGEKCPRGRMTNQEKLALAVFAVPVVAYIVAWSIS